MKKIFEENNTIKKIQLTDSENEIVLSISNKKQNNISIQIGKNTHNKIIIFGEGTETKIDIFSAEEGGITEVYGLFFSKKDKKTNINIQSHLKNNKTNIKKHFISIIGDKGTVDINANIFIAPKSQKTTGHLLEENIIIGKNTKIKALPMLDIQSDDVTASHGMKIEQIDSKKLFYMSARGIDKKKAQSLIITGNINRVVREISILENKQKEKLIKKLLQNIL